MEEGGVACLVDMRGWSQWGVCMCGVQGDVGLGRCDRVDILYGAPCTRDVGAGTSSPFKLG